MDREVIFRGKRLDNGQWLYGDLMFDNHQGCYIYPNDCTGLYTENEVDSHTVGQFTGLRDKRGRKIYEGDVVEVYDFTSVYASKYRGIVKMCCGSWCVEYEDSILDMVAHPRLFFDDFADRKTEVIGNIYDNPELLDNESK